MSEPSQTFGVIADIVAFIQQRGYEPGERLPSERYFTERFSVSRGVIREALAFLEATRFLVRRRNSGIFLADGLDQVSLEMLVLLSELGYTLDKDTLSECTEVRKILELQAIELACFRRTDKDLGILNSILEQSELALKSKESIADLDYEFHMSLFRATQNDVFTRVAAPFFLMAKSRRNAFFSNHENGIKSHKQHVALVKTVKKSDSEKAVVLMKAHIERVEHHFLTNLADEPRSKKND